MIRGSYNQMRRGYIHIRGGTFTDELGQSIMWCSPLQFAQNFLHLLKLQLASQERHLEHA